MTRVSGALRTPKHESGRMIWTRLVLLRSKFHGAQPTTPRHHDRLQGHRQKRDTRLTKGCLTRFTGAWPHASRDAPAERSTRPWSDVPALLQDSSLAWTFRLCMHRAAMALSMSLVFATAMRTITEEPTSSQPLLGMAVNGKPVFSDRKGSSGRRTETRRCQLQRSASQTGNRMVPARPVFHHSFGTTAKCRVLSLSALH